VSFVAAGEQQPEVDHAMQSEQSRKGTAQDHFHREASDSGYLSYGMATRRENRSRFFDVAYLIPAGMLQGKERIRIKFKSLKGGPTSLVY
jgi:hypothetical protein